MYQACSLNAQNGYLDGIPINSKINIKANKYAGMHNLLY